ncbi:MAG: hypothetical protein ACI9J3_003271 [Parvicellaceae bacterium]|jgi:hypothetical protein
MTGININTVQGNNLRYCIGSYIYDDEMRTIIIWYLFYIRTNTNCFLFLMRKIIGTPFNQ